MLLLPPPVSSLPSTVPPLACGASAKKKGKVGREAGKQGILYIRLLHQAQCPLTDQWWSTKKHWLQRPHTRMCHTQERSRNHIHKLCILKIKSYDELLNCKLPFRCKVWEISQGFQQDGYSQKCSYSTFLAVCEAYLTSLCEDRSLFAIHNKYATVMPKDILSKWLV